MEKRTRHTNKQKIEQVSKRTNKGTKKTNKQCCLFFFWFDAMAGAIACGQTKQIKRQASNHANKYVARFFWSDAMAEAISFGQMKQLKRQLASNHANQYKVMDFRCRNRPCSTYFQKPSSRACGSGCLAWPTSARGCVFELKLSKDKIIVDLAISNNNVYMAVAAGRAGWE